MKTASKKPDIKRYIKEEVRRAVKAEVSRTLKRFKIVVEKDDEIPDAMPTEPSPDIDDAPDTDPTPSCIEVESGSEGDA